MPPIQFEWDAGNEYKSVTKHKISIGEAMSIFADPLKKVGYDSKHSANRNALFLRRHKFAKPGFKV